MAFFTSAYKILAHLAPNWDTQLRADMQSLEDNLAEGGWTPGFGGSGATPGSGATFSGFTSRKGTCIDYFGAITFGSSPAWGTQPTLTNFNAYSSNVSAVFLHGTGRLIRAGSVLVNLHMGPAFFPGPGSTVTPTLSSNGQTLNTLSAAVAGDQIVFNVRAIQA